MSREEIGVWVLENRKLLWRLVRRFALHIPCGTPGDAFAELVLECYRVFPKWKKSLGRKSTFIWACVRNMSRNLRQKSEAAKRRPKNPHVASSAEDIAAPRAWSPDVVVDAKDELAAKLRKLAGTMIKKHHRAFLMRYMDERPWAEVAKKFGYSGPVTARQTIVESIRRVAGE